MGQQRTPTMNRQQNLLDLVDRVSNILETGATPQVTAKSLLEEYGDYALDIAQVCTQSFPGKRGAGKRTFWEDVTSLISKELSTEH